MALTRSLLKSMELSEEQVNTIIEEHVSTVNALKEQRDGFKDERDTIKKERDEFKKSADELTEVKKELDTLKKENWKEKFEDEHQKFEDFKTDVAGKEHSAKLQNAYKKLLAECKVGEKHIDSILKVTDFKDLKLNEDGTLDGVDALKKKINEDWSGFIISTGTKGADVENPPAGGSGSEANTRAAELAAKYHDNLYGKIAKEE